MKKKCFILSLFLILLFSFRFFTNANMNLPDTPPVIDVNDLKLKMQSECTYTGKYFKDGMYGYYYEIEVNNGNNSDNIQECFYNVEICFVSKQQDIASFKVNGDGEMEIQYTRKPPVSAFVAFNSSGATRGYEYTLLYGLGYTSNAYSGDRTAPIKYESLFNNRDLYSSEMKEYTYTEKFKVDSTKKHAHLILIGDVYVTEVTLRQYQKLWTHNSLIFEGKVRVYVYSKLWVRCDSFD